MQSQVMVSKIHDSGFIMFIMFMVNKN